MATLIEKREEVDRLRKKMTDMTCNISKKAADLERELGHEMYLPLKAAFHSFIDSIDNRMLGFILSTLMESHKFPINEAMGGDEDVIKQLNKALNDLLEIMLECNKSIYPASEPLPEKDPVMDEVSGATISEAIENKSD